MPRTHIRACGSQPAYQSLITDVYKPRLRPCASYQFGHPQMAEGKTRAVPLNSDIRAPGLGRVATALGISDALRLWSLLL
jgi:hypothetical protein